MQTYNSKDWSFAELRDALGPNEWNQLSIILSRLERGNSEVLITPVAERVGPDVLFDEWVKIFDEHSNLMNDVLIGIEEGERDKYGPRSVAKPFSEIEDTVLSSFTNATTSCDHLSNLPLKSSDKGILRPMSVDNAVKLIKLSTNAGLPTLGKKRNALAETLQDLDSMYSQNWPLVPFVRTEDSGKTRLVQGMPLSDIIQETRFFEPLFGYYRKLNHFSAMNGPESVNTAMTYLLSETVRLGQKCVSGDITAFDTTFGISLQDKVFDEMSYLFQGGMNYSLLYEIRYRFGHKGLVLPGYVKNGPHGIPSGSRGTNLVGSVGNDKVLGQPLRQVLGDDFASASSEPDIIFKRYADCGMELNPSKTVIADDHYLYLRMLFHPDYMRRSEVVGVYPTFRALRHLVYPPSFAQFESFDIAGKDYFSIRSLSILENCKYHPLFEELVKLWLKYDKYGLPSEGSLRKYVLYIRETTGATGTTNQYGSDPRGLTNFESYKLAVKLST